MMSTNQHSH